MTLSELVVEVYENLGEASDLLPYDDVNSTTIDISSVGWGKLVGYVNRAYYAVLNYKSKRGKLVKFQVLNSTVNFKSVVVENTAQGGTSEGITLSAADVQADDYYNDWIVSVESGTGSGQVRIVMDYDTASKVASVNRDWDTTPDATSEYKLYKNFYDVSEMGIVDAEKFLSTNKLYDYELKQNLPYGSDTRIYVDNLENESNPTEYVFKNNKLYFNYPVNEAKWFRLEYREMPGDLSLEADEPAISVAYHDAIVIYATWLAMIKDGENGDAYARKNDWIDRMEMVRQEREGAYDNEESNMDILIEYSGQNNYRR